MGPKSVKSLKLKRQSIGVVHDQYFWMIWSVEGINSTSWIGESNVGKIYFDITKKCYQTFLIV